MELIRKITVGASLGSIALSTGFLMQHGDGLMSFFRDTPPPALSIRTVEEPRIAGVGAVSIGTAQDSPSRLVHKVGLDTTLPNDPSTAPLSFPPAGALSNRLAATADVPTQEMPQSHAQISAFGLPCDVALTATPSSGAMVDLTLTAPCSAGEAVNLRHGALRMTLLTDSAGVSKATVPALSIDARFSARFDNGTEVSATATVPDAQDYDRVALMWQGRPAMQIHAFENGAEFGTVGHIHDDNTQGKVTGARLISLGAGTVPGGWTTQVLSAPATAREAGVLRVHIEAEITSSTCGREVTAVTLQNQTEPVDLTLSMPGCDAIGDVLVLKNILHDIKLARN